MTQQATRPSATGNDRVDARVARTRAAVLDAGARLLFTDGWNAVTHVRVAEESGVGRATVYRHWPTVDDLLTDVLVDCQTPLEPGEPTGDTHADLITEITTFVDALQHSRLPEILITAMERSAADPRFQAMHASMTRISRDPVWTVTKGAIDQGELDPNLTEEIVAGHTLGPILYQRLFDGQHITPTDIERTVDVFLTAFTT